MKDVYQLIAESLDEELGASSGEPLTEMAQSRKEAILKVSRLEGTYLEHICKVVLYRNSTGNLHHWLGEIAQCLADINNIKVKPGDKKLDAYTLQCNLFMATGDSVEECGFHIKRVAEDLLKRYPEAEITPTLLEQAFEVLVDLSDYFSPILAAKNSRNKEWFRIKLEEYFEDL